MTDWKLKTGDTEAQAVYYNDIIYITGKNNLLAINLEGVLLWEYKTTAEILSKPCIYEEHIYFGDINGLLYKLDIADSNFKLKYRLLWKLRLGGALFSSPIIYNDYLYIGCDDHYLYKINIVDVLNGDENENENERIVWKFKTGNEIYYNPVFYNNLVFISSSDTFLYCLDLDSNIKWKYTINNAIITEPLIYKNSIYIGTSGGDVILLNLKGELLKRNTLGMCIFYKPYFLNNHIYIITLVGKVLCYNFLLESIWDYDCGEILVMCSTYMNNICVITDRSELFLLNYNDGTLINSKNILNKIIFSPPIIIGDKLLIKDRKGGLYLTNIL